MTRFQNGIIPQLAEEAADILEEVAVSQDVEPVDSVIPAEAVKVDASGLLDGIAV